MQFAIAVKDLIEHKHQGKNNITFRCDIPFLLISRSNEPSSTVGDHDETAVSEPNDRTEEDHDESPVKRICPGRKYMLRLHFLFPARRIVDWPL